MSARREFLRDYPAGVQDGRYVEAQLPSLPFGDGHFELAVCYGPRGGIGNRPWWGARRIRGESLKLGSEVSERTVSRVMPAAAEPRSQSWRTFLTNHLDSTVAVDVFAVPALTCRILLVFVVLAHDRRRLDLN
jgi:hypothetical protein